MTFLVATASVDTLVYILEKPDLAFLSSIVLSMSSSSSPRLSVLAVVSALVLVLASGVPGPSLALAAPAPSSFTLFDVPEYVSSSGLWSEKQCGVLFFADGVGERHVGLEVARGFLETTVENVSSASIFWHRGSTVPPPGDASVALRALRGGCSSPLWRHFARGGAAYGLLATKCADDGTAAGFLVTPEDRYDLPSVGRAIAGLSPPPYLVSGGFSRSLWRRTVGLPHVEFDSSGSKAYGETCEYVSPATLEERVSRAVRKGLDAGGDRGFFLAVSDADVDMASHARNGRRVEETVRALLSAATATAETLSIECPDRWRVAIVGSHETGGPGGGAAGEHGHHSPPHTPVPVFVSGSSIAGNGSLGRIDYDSVGKLVAPRLPCLGTDPAAPVRAPRRMIFHRPDERSAVSTADVEFMAYARHATGHGHGDGHGWDRGEGWVGFFYVFFLTLLFFMFCAWPLLPIDDRRGPYKRVA